MKKYLILLLLLNLATICQGQNLNNGSIAFWTLDETSGPRLDIYNNLVLTPNNNVINRYGINDGICDSKSVYVYSGGRLAGNNLPINYPNGFSVAGWFSLERAESYASPFSQTLLSQWTEMGDNREWKIWFKKNQNIIYTDIPNIKTGQICFTISDNGTNTTEEVCSDFMVYTDSPFFVYASYINQNEIKISAGNKYGNLSSKVKQTSSIIATKNNNLIVGAEVNNSGALAIKQYGSADNIGIWNRELTPNEITYLIDGHNPISNTVDPTKRVAFLGNSITYGFAYSQAYTLSDKLAFSYPRRVETLLPGNYQIANYGSRGLRTHHVLQKLNTGVISMDYDWISIAIGINDLRACVNTSTIIQNLTMIYDDILNSNPNVKLLVNTIPPYLGDIFNPACPLSNSNNQASYDAVNNFIMSYGTNHPRVFHSDVASVLKSSSNPYATAAQFNSGDFIHPNQLGCDAMANNIANLIINEDNLVIENCCVDIDYDGVCDSEDPSICTASPHTIVNPVGVSTNGNNISKTAGTSWGNGGGSTDISLSNNDYLVYNVIPNKATMVGLSSSDPNAHYNSINYALYARHDNKLYVWENGVNKTPAGLGSYDANSILKISIENNTVSYYSDNTLLYTSTNLITSNLVVDFAMFHQNAEINNLQVYNNCCAPSSYTIDNPVGISINPNNITKTAGTSWGNGGGSTAISLSENDYLVYNVIPNKATMVGLSSSDPNAHYTSINYALYSRHDNKLYVWENGVNKTPSGLGSYDANSTLKISIENGMVNYYNGSTLLYTSTNPVTSNLIVDFAMFHQNAEINNLQVYNNCCALAPYTIDNPIGISINANNITKTAGTSWGNGGGSTDISLSENDHLVYNVIPNKATMVGLSSSDPNAHYTSINYAFYARHDNKLYVWENGVNKTPWGLGNYDANSVLKISIENGMVNYYNDNVLLYTSTSPVTSNLIVDFAMFHQNAEINNLEIYHNCTIDTGSGTNTSTSRTTENLLSNSVNEVNKEADTVIEAEENTFKIFPNPAKNVIHIDTNLKSFNLHCSNILGEQIQLIPNGNSIDVSNFPKGIYIISIYQEQTLVGVEKLIIE